MNKKYDIDIILNKVKNNRGIRVKDLLLEIKEIGIKMFGYVDFLCNNAGYAWKKKEIKEKSIFDQLKKKQQTNTRRLFFENHNCRFCKAPAEMYRMGTNIHFYSCNDKKCITKGDILTKFVRIEDENTSFKN